MQGRRMEGTGRGTRGDGKRPRRDSRSRREYQHYFEVYIASIQSRMGTVQFREDDDVLEFLRGEGLNANQLSRELLEARVRRLRAEKRMKELAGSNVELGDAVALVRELREER